MCPACLSCRWHRNLCPTDRKKSYWALQTILLKSWRANTSDENQWKSVKISENQWKSLKINENQWKSMEINGNQFGRPDHLFLAHPTSKVSSEASSGTFFDRLDIKSNGFGMTNTLVTFIRRHRWHNCKITRPTKNNLFFWLSALGWIQPQIPTPMLRDGFTM